MTKRERKQTSPFVMMMYDTMNTPAWLAMSHGARALYMALKRFYFSKEGNAVYLSERDAEKILGAGSHRRNIRRWFRELQYYGFIVQETPASLGVEGKGKAAHWRLTEMHYLHQTPTRDYLGWGGEKFHERKPPSYYKRRDFIARKKQNPGVGIVPKVEQASSPPLEHTSSPPSPQSGDDVCPIEKRPSGDDAYSISRLPYGRRSKRSTKPPDTDRPVGPSPAIAAMLAALDLDTKH